MAEEPWKCPGARHGRLPDENETNEWREAQSTAIVHPHRANKKEMAKKSATDNSRLHERKHPSLVQHQEI